MPHPTFDRALAPARGRLAAVALAAVALTFACSRPADDAPPAPETAPAAEAPAPATPAPETATTASALDGTRWRLVEIQSMDDSQGATKPEDPSLYTLAFVEDGRVAMRLNCNRGNGSYQVTPGEDGQSGSITIGPLAVTLAQCPPPSLDERIARDMDFVRTFLLRDGRLSLSLMADGGIYLWEPNPDGDDAGEE